MATTSEQIAWAAGFFDGEGCFTTNQANTNGKRYLRFAVTQKTPDLLYQMREIIGAGEVTPYAARTHSSAGYRLQTSGRKAFAVASVLWPWLGEQKKADFKRALRDVRESRKTMIKPQRPARVRIEAQRMYRAGVSRLEIAATLNVPQPTISYWTKGGGPHREVSQ